MHQPTPSEKHGFDSSVTADPNATTSPRSLLSLIITLPFLLWDFTESNFPTFVIPNTAFGLLGALAGSRLLDGTAPLTLDILQRIPLLIAFNWFNVLIFDLSNQRSPRSVEEDLANKPWRPIPSGKATGDQARRALLAVLPAVLAMNYALGVWREGVFIQILTWMYNDLGGGDEIFRDAILAVAYALFNGASLQIAAGEGADVGRGGLVWVAMISGVILTTMQVQDLKDQEGDRGRGRRTLPLACGDWASRVMLAVFVPMWSGVCACFWGPVSWANVVPWACGLAVTGNVLFRRDPKSDDRTWRLWCLWTMGLYSLPVLSGGFSA